MSSSATHILSLHPSYGNVVIRARAWSWWSVVEKVLWLVVILCTYASERARSGTVSFYRMKSPFEMWNNQYHHLKVNR